MFEWGNLEKDIGLWLSSFASGNLQFRNGYQAIVGFPYDGFRSDGMLTDGRVLIAVEIEAGQTHPDTNVSKYWLLQERQRAYDKIVLFHVYTPKFNSYGWRKALAEFLAEKMGEQGIPIEYVLCDYRGASDYEEVLSRLKAEIAERILEEFGAVLLG